MGEEDAPRPHCRFAGSLQRKRQHAGGWPGWTYVSRALTSAPARADSRTSAFIPDGAPFPSLVAFGRLERRRTSK